MLETIFDLLCSAEIEKEGQDVDVDYATSKDCYLVWELRKIRARERGRWEGGGGRGQWIFISKDITMFNISICCHGNIAINHTPSFVGEVFSHTHIRTHILYHLRH